MNQKPHTQNFFIVGLFFLLVCIRIFYADQNRWLEFISDASIVVVLLAFSENILSTLIHGLVWALSKTIRVITSKP